MILSVNNNMFCTDFLIFVFSKACRKIRIQMNSNQTKPWFYKITNKETSYEKNDAIGNNVARIFLYDSFCAEQLCQEMQRHLRGRM